MVMATQRKTHAWTKSEIETIQAYFKSGLTYKEIALKTGFTYFQVKGKLRNMRNEVNHNPRRLWTPEEEKRLREMYPKFTITTIKRYIKRSRKAILLKAWKMGLSCEYRDDWFTPEELATVLGYGEDYILRHIYDGHLKCDVDISKKATRPKVHRITYKHAREFITRYASELCKRPVDMPLIIDILGIERASSNLDSELREAAINGF